MVRHSCYWRGCFIRLMSLIIGMGVWMWLINGMRICWGCWILSNENGKDSWIRMFKRIVDFNCPSLTFGGTKLIGKVCPSAFGVSIFLLLLPEIEYHLTLWLCIILTTRIFGIEAANCRIIQQVNQDVSSDVTQSRENKICKVKDLRIAIKEKI